MARPGISPPSVGEPRGMTDHIIIDLCGRLADAAGPNLIMLLSGPTPVAEVLAMLAAEYPALGAALAATTSHIAIDEIMAADTAMIAPGQRLALFPPVSGG